MIVMRRKTVRTQWDNDDKEHSPSQGDGPIGIGRGLLAYAGAISSIPD